MRSTEKLFTESIKANRPLSLRLLQRFSRPLREEISQLTEAALAGESDEAVVSRLIDRVRIDPPTLEGKPGHARRSEEYRPTAELGTSERVERWDFAITLRGDAELLSYWPDADAHGNLRPIDADIPGVDVEHLGVPPTGLDTYGWNAVRDRWYVDTPSGSQALCTWIDLSPSDMAEVTGGGRDVRKLIDEWVEEIKPTIEAIGAQTRRFFEVDLRLDLEDRVRQRREYLGTRAAVEEHLSWPEGWKADKPALAPEPREWPRNASPRELSVPHHRRLAPATYVDALRTMRVWASAVERYPVAFRKLHEEELSSVLAATLNTSLPGAHREVYSVTGKTDIYIRANAIDPGAGPEKVFVCEAKIWGGAQTVDGSTDKDSLNQLLDYLEAKDTACVLILYIHESNVRLVRERALAALRKRPDYVGEWEKLPVDGWPVLRFDMDGDTVSVCIAFVDLSARKAASARRPPATASSQDATPASSSDTATSATS